MEMIAASNPSLFCQVSTSSPAKRQTFRSCLLIVAASLFFASVALGQRMEMTKIVYRCSGPLIAADSPLAQPATIYRAGEKYERVEEPPDPKRGLHVLRITKEPDAWRINLVDRTAIHILDKGPVFAVHHHITASATKPGERDPFEGFLNLEFGNESIFFRQQDAKALGPRKIDGKDANAFAMKSGPAELTLFEDTATGKPLRIDVALDGKPQFSLHYLEYENGLPFDPSLFELPEGLKITEAAK
jgi:hypothetical protein